jgi:hypothetical protein
MARRFQAFGCGLDHLRGDFMDDVAVTYLAAITEADYPAFLALARTNFPQTYDDWLDLFHKLIGYYREVGHEVVLVPAKPDEFARFCNAKRSTYNLNSLSIFANKKGTLRH